MGWLAHSLHSHPSTLASQTIPKPFPKPLGKKDRVAWKKKKKKHVAMRWALQNSLHFSKREGKGLKQLKEELESPPPLSVLLSSGSYANTGAPPWAREHKLGLNPKGGNCLGLQSASTSRTLNQSVSIKPNSTKLRGESFSNTIIYFFQTKEQWMKYTVNEMSPSSLPKGISVLFRCLPSPKLPIHLLGRGWLFCIISFPLQ